MPELDSKAIKIPLHGRKIRRCRDAITTIRFLIAKHKTIHRYAYMESIAPEIDLQLAEAGRSIQAVAKSLERCRKKLLGIEMREELSNVAELAKHTNDTRAN